MSQPPPTFASEMKKTRIIVLCACLGLLSARDLEAQRIKGSDTVLPVSQQAAEAFMQENPEALVTVTGGGTGVGISALVEGTTDLAQASRRIRFDEKQKLRARGKTLVEVELAYDGLAVIVHPSNPVTRLTREELEGIFTGKIKNWRELGGPDLKIVPYARETSSGTYEIFKEKVLRHRNYMSGIMSLPATGAIVQSIGQTRGGIGYVGLAYLHPGLQAVALSFDGGQTYVEPTVENATAQSYPLVRPLYYYYTKDKEAGLLPFLDYVLSAGGQARVKAIGFVPVR